MNCLIIKYYKVLKILNEFKYNLCKDRKMKNNDINYQQSVNSQKRQ